MQELLFKIGPSAFDCEVQYFCLYVEKWLHHKEATLVLQLAMEEEFQFISKLPRCHCWQFILFKLRFHHLDIVLQIGS